MHKPFTFEALGTRWWIELFEDLPAERRTVILDDGAAFVHRFEKKYSRFLADSLVSTLNRERSLVSPDTKFIDLLTFGKGMYIRTDTRFNILTGHIQEARGYDENYSFTETKADVAAGNPVTDLLIDQEKIELLGDSKLDLGGFGKGYLIDQLAAYIKETHELEFFLINGGGDLYVTSNLEKPVELHLEHPTQAKSSLGTVSLHNAAFASSSPFKRTWMTASGQQSHIVGETAVASYIKSDKAAEADVFATVALLSSQKELETLSLRENFSFTLFNPATNQIVRHKDF